MSELFTPAVVPLAPPAADDPRLGHILGERVRAGEPARAAILGFPSDEGVRRNGGRPGAAAAPAAIRAALYRLTPDADAGDRFVDLLGLTRDLGDLIVSGDLEADQERLGRAVAPLLRDGLFVIVVGGGHETAYGHLLGYAAADRAVEILNWDAHPDVRPTRDGRGHSGSPFRQALDHPSGCCRRYSVAGLLPQSAARAHVDLVRDRGGQIWWRDDVTVETVREPYARLEGPALVSFDLDAVDQAFAPGVSAPAAGGLDPAVWLRAARLAGRTPAVGSVEVVEVSPPHDRDGQTARLAALTIWQVLRGLAERDGGGPG